MIGAAIRLVASAAAVPSDRNTKQFVEEHTVPATRQRPTHHVELQAAIRRHDAPESLGVERGQVLELTRRRVIGELARRLPVLCVHQVRLLEGREARKRVFELGMRRAHAPKIRPGRTTQLPSSSPPIAMRSTRSSATSSPDTRFARQWAPARRVRVRVHQTGRSAVPSRARPPGVTPVCRSHPGASHPFP